MSQTNDEKKTLLLINHYNIRYLMFNPAASHHGHQNQMGHGEGPPDRSPHPWPGCLAGGESRERRPRAVHPPAAGTTPAEKPQTPQYF